VPLSTEQSKIHSHICDSVNALTFEESLYIASPYRVFYIVRDDAIIVFAVLHTSRHERQWRHRLQVFNKAILSQ